MLSTFSVSVEPGAVLMFETALAFNFFIFFFSLTFSLFLKLGSLLLFKVNGMSKTPCKSTPLPLPVVYVSAGQ